MFSMRADGLIDLRCVSLVVHGTSLIEWRHLTWVRQFTIGGASLYQSRVRHFSNGGIHLGCVSLPVRGASLIGFTSGASVYESRVRHFWTFGFTSGASVYQSGVRHLCARGNYVLYACPKLPLKSGELCGKTRHTFFGSARLVSYRGEPLYG